MLDNLPDEPTLAQVAVAEQPAQAPQQRRVPTWTLTRCSNGTLIVEGPHPEWLERLADHIESCKGTLAEAAANHAIALNNTTRLEDERALVKQDGIARLMEAKVATSATAAEKIIEQDDIYMAHRERQRAAVMREQTTKVLIDSVRSTLHRLVTYEATLLAGGRIVLPQGRTPSWYGALARNIDPSKR